MMMMMMRRLSSLRVRAKPRHLPYIYIYIYIYIYVCVYVMLCDVMYTRNAWALPRRCSVEVSHSQRNVDATSQIPMEKQQWY